MRKEERVSPEELEKKWQKKRSKFAQQVMLENPEKPGEVLNMIKQMDDIQHQLTELLTDSFVQLDYLKERVRFQEVAEESQRLQQEKQVSKKPEHLELLSDMSPTDEF